MRIRSAVYLASVFILTIFLISCGGNSSPSSPPVIPPATGYGLVQGGLTPISGASVQMYAVGTSGIGSSATPLFQSPLLTDASGKFNFAASYTCPSSTALIYVVATGGNPGLTSGANNPQIKLIAAIGQCSSLAQTSNITINELTTVAAIAALAPFMHSSTEIGSDSSNAAALVNAFSIAAEMADVSTGSVPGAHVPSNVTIPINIINTLGNILAACVDTNGGVAGDGSPCGKFFQYTTPTGGQAPTDTAAAELEIANNPSFNVAQLYALIPAQHPFDPQLSTAPADLAVYLTYSSGLVISPRFAEFPPTYVSLSSPESITLTNSGSSAISISSISFIGSVSDFSETNNCVTLAAGASCAISATFTPTTTGQRFSLLQIASNAPNSIEYVPLIGTGLASASASFSLMPSTLTFSQAGVPQTVTLKNTGAGAINVTSIQASGGADLTQTNDCPSLLPATATCTVSAQVGSLSASPTAGTITAMAGAGPNIGSANVQVNVTSNVNFSAAAISFGDWAMGVTSSLKQISVDSGNPASPAPPLSGTISGANASDFAIVGGNCSGGTYKCSLNLSFTPSAQGVRTAILTTEYGNVALTGNGVPGNPSFTITNYDGGSQTAGASSLPGTITVVNNGNVPLQLTQMSISGDNASDFAVTNGCNATLNLAENCTLTVVFTPSHTGTRTATLTLTDPTLHVSKSASLKGVGVAGPPIISPATITFPATVAGTSSSPKPITISAPDGDGVSIALISGTHSDNFSFSGTDSACMAQTPCTISVVFRPYTNGDSDAVYSVIDKTTQLSASFTLHGTSQKPNAIFSNNPISFGQVVVGSTSVSQMLNISNTGNSPLTVTGVGITGPNPANFAITANTCASPVNPSASCSLSVAFLPTALSTFNAALSFTTNDPLAPTASISLSGTGVTAAPTGLTISPSTLTFTDQYIKFQTPFQVLTITNTGTSVANFTTSVPNGSGDFSVGYSISCLNIQPGASCRATASFHPTAAGPRSGTLRFTATSGQVVDIPVSGNGLAPKGGPVTLTPSSITISAGVLQTFTVTNTGNESVAFGGVAGQLRQINNCGTEIAAQSICQIQLLSGTSNNNNDTPSTLSVLTSASANITTATFTRTVNDFSSQTDFLAFGTTAVGVASPVQYAYANYTGSSSYPSWLPQGITGPNAADFSAVPGSVAGETCYHSLCQLDVTFKPTGTGLRTATLHTEAGDVQLYGVGESDGADFTLTETDFPSTIVPGFVGYVTVTNTGSAPLNLSSLITRTSDPIYGASSFVLGACGETPMQDNSAYAPNLILDVGKSCTAPLSYYAYQNNGTESATLQYTDNISGISKTLTLNGDSGPVLSLPSISPNSLTLPNTEVGNTSAPSSVSITTVGNHPVTVSLASTANFSLDTGTCATQTPCQASVQFHPTANTVFSTVLTALDTVTGKSTNISVQGTGGIPVISVSPMSLSYAARDIGTTSISQTVTIGNSGDAPLLPTISVTGANAADFAVLNNTCQGQEITNGQSCTVDISFSPKASGSRAASLQIVSHALSSPDIVSLSGTGN